ncbi:MAG: hypothetical protein FWG71_00860 [Synergistaceae bacterium]|nr:hypothetical protein [Synergistaceae bacterium]
MIQPVDLQLAHFNVERSAQLSRDAIAAALQTGEGKEIVKESVRRTQTVQAGLAAAEPRKVKRREEEEERERRREGQGQGQKKSFSQSDPSEENEKYAEPANAELEIKVKSAPKKFELYA